MPTIILGAMQIDRYAGFRQAFYFIKHINNATIVGWVGDGKGYDMEGDFSQANDIRLIMFVPRVASKKRHEQEDNFVAICCNNPYR